MLNNKRSFKTCLISCIDELTYGIGYNNELLYKCNKDMKYFKNLTSKSSDNKINAILMGRKTYESIGCPLPNRINLVVTKSINYLDIKDKLYFFNNIECAEDFCNNNGNIETLFIIGGESIYSYYLSNGNYDWINLYFVQSSSKKTIDTFFPRFNCNNHRIINLDENYQDSINSLNKESIKTKRIEYYKLNNIEEEQYLNLLRKVLNEGELRQTRNSMTKSLFGNQIKFDLRNGKFPLLTTKKVFFKGIAKELLWFLRGSTNAKELQNDGIHIWDGNSSKEFLNNNGLSHLEDGDCGAIYSHQFRRFNAPYRGCNAKYEPNEGFDQIQDCINQIKNNPNSRRIILSVWNPIQLKEMCLPPCHVLYQFYVKDGYLNCSMYQRSSDLFLGLPFNIGSCSLLIYILSHYCDLKPGYCIISLGDYHIYEPHYDAVNEQLSRLPYKFPTFEILGDKPQLIEDYKFENFIFNNYNSHSIIKAPMIA